jgi:hypothetical protein
MSGAGRRRHKSNSLDLHRPAIGDTLSRLKEDGRAGPVCHAASGALLMLLILNATDPGGEIHMSDRSIAAALHCDRKTWREWSSFLEERGEIERIGKYKNANSWEGGWRIVNFAEMSGLVQSVVQSVGEPVGESFPQQTGSDLRVSPQTYKTFKTHKTRSRSSPAGEFKKSGRAQRRKSTMTRTQPSLALRPRWKSRTGRPT